MLGWARRPNLRAAHMPRQVLPQGAKTRVRVFADIQNVALRAHCVGTAWTAFPRCAIPPPRLHVAQIVRALPPCITGHLFCPVLWGWATDPSCGEHLCCVPGGGGGQSSHGFAQEGRPVQILDPSRVRKLLGVWRGGGVGGSAGQQPGSLEGGQWVPQHTYLKMIPMTR